MALALWSSYTSRLYYLYHCRRIMYIRCQVMDAVANAIAIALHWTANDVTPEYVTHLNVSVKIPQTVLLHTFAEMN